MKKIWVILIAVMFVFAGGNQVMAQKSPEERAVIAKKNKKYKEAIALYEEAIKTEPKNFKHYLNKGTCEIKAKQFPAANESFNKVLELKPNFPPAYTQLGNLAKVQKDLKGAAENYRKAIEFSNPKQQMPLKMLLVDVLIKDNNLNEAEKTLAEVAEVAPENFKVLLLSGDVKSAKKDYAGAVAEYNKILVTEKFKALKPEQQAQFYFATGQAYLSMGDQLNAQKNWRKAFVGPYVDKISSAQPEWAVEFSEAQLAKENGLDQGQDEEQTRGMDNENNENQEGEEHKEEHKESVDDGWGF